MSAASSIVLDPQMPAAIVGPNGSIDQVTYPASTIALPQKTITLVRLRSLVMSNEAYPISDFASVGGLTNNQITVVGVGAAGIPPGFYDATTFMAAVQAALQVLVPGATATFDPATLLVTLTFTGQSLTFTNLSPWLELGIPLGTYVDSVTGTAPLNLSGPRSLYIRIPELTTNSYVYYGTAPFHFVYPLTKAPISESQLNWLDAGKTRCPVQLDSLWQMTVMLYFTRAGLLYPYITATLGGGILTSYQLMLEIS